MKSYTFKKFKKQLLPYLLSFAIVLGAFSWKAPEADAIATEAVVAAIISVAIGSGLAFAVDRMTSPEVDAYWTGQAQQWLQSIGQSYSDFVDQAEQNMSAKDGKLILGGSFYQSIQNFLSWWKGENGVSDSQAIVYNVEGLTVATTSMKSRSALEAAGVTLFHCVPGSHYRIDLGSCYVELSQNPNRAKSIIRTFVDSLGVSHDLGYSDCTPAYGGATYVPDYYICQDNQGHFFLGQVYGTDVAQHLAYDLNAWDSSLDSFIPDSPSSLSVSQPSEEVVLEPTEALPSVALDVGASSEDDLETVIRAVFDGYRDNTLVVDQELTGAGEGEGTDTDGLFGILHGISGTLSDVLDAVLSIPATLAATVTGFIGSIGNFLSGAYFGFSGIWHYVVSWVGSMAAGAAVIWSIWNGLPSAMVIPVFATAVIVIVVGLWRRFFE